MIIIAVFFLLCIGAFATYLLPPQNRTSHILVSFIPAAALGALLLRLPLPDSFSVAWYPSDLFPEPLRFSAASRSISFAAFLCGALLMIEWTRPMRRSAGRSSRVAAYLLTASGVLACLASNPLSVIVLWSWIDFLSFLAVFFLKSPVEIGREGVSSSLTHSTGILAANMIGNILVLFSVFLGAADSPADFAIGWGDPAANLSTAILLAGVTFRLLVSPLLFTSSRMRTTSTGVDILLRIVSPAAVLCFLSNVWPPESALASGFPVPVFLAVLFSAVLLVGGWRWCAASSPFSRRDFFFLMLPPFGLLSALATPFADRIFPAVGAMLILGGAVLLVHIGFLVHRRWMAVFPIALGFLYAGIPFFPMSVWSLSVYPVLVDTSGIPVLLVLIFSQVFAVGAVFRSAFETVEEFPPNEPLFLLTFSFGMVACLALMLFPGWGGGSSAASFAAPAATLLGSASLAFFIHRSLRAGVSLLPLPETILFLERLQRGLVASFQKSAGVIAGVESFLSGEGAMLWSLGIALLLYLVFRGG
jgi:hypothetical protein